MRLLVVTPEYPPHHGGGILKYYALMTAAWKAAGVDVTVLVATPFSAFDDYVHDGVPVRVVPLEQIDRHSSRMSHLAPVPLFRRYASAGAAAADWIRTHGDAFDIVETTDFGLVFAPIVAAADRPPVVVKLHGSLGQISQHEPPASASELDYALARMTESVLLPHADGLQAYSPSNAREWSMRLGVPVEFVAAPHLLPPLRPRTEGSFAGIVAGRIQPWKGPELLCRAFERLGHRAPRDLTIAWAGRDTDSGPEGQSMSRWLESRYPSLWGTRIVPVGQKSPEEVTTLQLSARFVVVPSAWDTFNYTLVEAMGLACATIASSGAGASYLIHDGANGFHIEPQDADALADRLMAVYDASEAQRRHWGHAARQTIASELSPESAARASLASLTRVASAPAKGRAIAPWVQEFFEASGTRTVGTGYLENVSIRELARHLKKRVGRKVAG